MKGRDNMKRFSPLIIILAIILGVGSCSLVKRNKPAKEAMSVNGIIYPNSTGKDLGEIESIIEYGDNSVIGAHFPIFEIDNIDSISKNLIELEVEEFKTLVKDSSTEDKNYKSELSIDYETYQFSDNIVSIKFTILKSMPYYAHPDIKIITKVYDLENKKLIELSDIMENNYLEKVSELVVDYFNTTEHYKEHTYTDMFKNGLLPNLSNYSNFLLEEDKITFIFQRYQLFSGSLGMPTVEIPYSELEDYLNSKFIDSMPVTVVSSQNNNDMIPVEEKKVRIVSPTREINPAKPMVALTFDDGPNKNTTIPILDTLKEYDGVATFFILGNRIPNNGDILERMITEGSEIGNHSFNHQQLTTITSSEVKDQMDRTQDAVMEVVGSKPRLMRPTYGSYNDNLKSQIDMPMILWSIDTLDWKSRNAEKVSNHVLTNVKDGDIVLMHDIYGSTADAVKTIVPELINRGYQLVTVSELYELRGEALEVGNTYSSSYK